MRKSIGVQKCGNKFRVRWTDENGTRQSIYLTSKKDAETLVLERKLTVQRVKVGLLQRINEEKCFKDLSEYYLNCIVNTKRSPKDLTSIIRAHLLPFFGEIRLMAIGQEYCLRYQQSKSHLSKKTVSNHLALLTSMLNLAVDLKWLEEVPKIKKPKIEFMSEKYEYLKSKEEISCFLKSAEKEGSIVHGLYSTAVYTGLRAGELAGLLWEDVDLEKRIICVRKSFNKITKGGYIRYVPIVDVLLPLLIEFKKRSFCDYVFPSATGTMLLPSARIFQEIFHRVLENAGFPKSLRGGKERAYIRFHDLRHTFASHWLMEGGDIYRLQKVLGHKSMEMTQRYAHFCTNAFTEDFSRFNQL